MATASISAEYADDAADFANELRENGFECSFGIYRDSEPDSLAPPSTYVEDVKAYVFPSEWKANFSADMRVDDALYFVSNAVNFNAVTHMIDDEGKHRKVMHAKQFKPDGATVIYNEIQVR